MTNSTSRVHLKGVFCEQPLAHAVGIQAEVLADENKAAGRGEGRLEPGEGLVVQCALPLMRVLPAIEGPPLLQAQEGIIEDRGPQSLVSRGFLRWHDLAGQGEAWSFVQAHARFGNHLVI